MKKIIIYFVIITAIFSAFFVRKTNYAVSPVFEERYPSILNFGDVMLDRGVRNQIELRNKDPFEYVKEYESV